VSLTPPQTAPASLTYQTGDGTATAGSDYTATSGVLNFAACQASATVSVPVIGDLVDEPDETFFLYLTTSGGAQIFDGVGQATILDNDPPPNMAISDVSVTEGNTGTTNAVFNVTLSGTTSSSIVTVNFQTAGNTATSGVDFGIVVGTLTFYPGTTTQTITVPVIGDRVFEGNETFFVNLSGATNAVLTDSQGVGTILDDDAAGLSIDDVVVVEGKSARFTVTLSPVNNSQTVTVNYATANGTATAPADYTTTSGTLTFPPGTATQTILVPTATDALVELKETFVVNLSGASNAAIAVAQGTASLLDPGGGADFNGDGKPDILWRYSAGGNDFVWLMNGTAVGSGVVLPTVTDQSWVISGTADFNGDGQPDILWRNQATGDNLVWLVNNLSVSGGVVLTSVPDPNWRIGGTGDFDGDGKPDILWRNYATGDDVVWFMNGTTIKSGAVLTSVTDLNWTMVGAGDFNADGKPDILWRNSATGDNLVWYMNGTTLLGGAVLMSIPDTNWVVGGVGDFNADGRPDILWRNQSVGGDNVIWFMNGATIAGGVVLAPITDTNWRIVGPR
jgi:Calx-beta domain-containing protein/VCBS repeat protein